MMNGYYSRDSLRVPIGGPRPARPKALKLECEHTWRYSNSRDVFYCTTCYAVESAD